MIFNRTYEAFWMHARQLELLSIHLLSLTLTIFVNWVSSRWISGSRALALPARTDEGAAKYTATTRPPRSATRSLPLRVGRTEPRRASLQCRFKGRTVSPLPLPCALLISGFWVPNALNTLEHHPDRPRNPKTSS